jgi:hypothetical protein
MTRYGNIAIVTTVVAIFAGVTPSLAQSTTFRRYHCADGSEFIVGFYPYDSSAYLQIDGGSIKLPRRLAFAGTRYSSRGVTLKITKSGSTTIKRSRQRETACDIMRNE